MRIAVSTEKGYVSLHFGSCPVFMIMDIEEGKIVKREEIENPGDFPDELPRFFYEKGVNYIIAGAMGSRARGFFEKKGIGVHLGVLGKVDEVVDEFIKGF